MPPARCSAGIHSRLQWDSISISLHVKKKGVKCPHQGTGLMEIFFWGGGHWSLAVKQDKTKGAFSIGNAPR